MFIGFAINVLLLGTMVTQVYLYYTTYRGYVKLEEAECGTQVDVQRQAMDKTFRASAQRLT